MFGPGFGPPPPHGPMGYGGYGPGFGGPPGMYGYGPCYGRHYHHHGCSIF